MCRQELAADLAELEEKVDNISVSNPRVAQEYRCVHPRCSGPLSAASGPVGRPPSSCHNLCVGTWLSS